METRLEYVTVERMLRCALAGGEDAEPQEIWFLLHGYGQLADDFLDSCSVLAAPGRLLVAPEAPSRFYLEGGRGRIGASWMTSREREREVSDYVRALDAVHARLVPGDSAAHVSVLGFSQGGATACRWATLGSARVDRVITWAGGVPEDLSLERLSERELVCVVGSRDRYIDEARLQREEERLAAVPHRLLRFEGGHRVDEALLRSLAEGS